MTNDPLIDAVSVDSPTTGDAAIGATLLPHERERVQRLHADLMEREAAARQEEQATGDPEVGSGPVAEAVTEEVVHGGEATMLAQHPEWWGPADGLVFYPDEASDPLIPCHVIRGPVDAEGKPFELVFKKGVVGALSEAQKPLFCAREVIEAPTDRELDVITRYHNASTSCDRQGAHTYEDRISCMQSELLAHDPAADIA